MYIILSNRWANYIFVVGVSETVSKRFQKRKYFWKKRLYTTTGVLSDSTSHKKVRLRKSKNAFTKIMFSDCYLFKS